MFTNRERDSRRLGGGPALTAAGMALGGAGNGSALAAYGKRKEQVERWQQSETASQPSEIKDRPKRVNFDNKCIFLAASTSGEKSKVARMIRDGYDVNAVDGDGITALHQACIEDNIDMVEFLLAYGADVNIGDNEGWTPLHAVASCNFTSIAKILLENGADSTALNNDCSLPVDICKNEDVKELLRSDLAAKRIDVDAARKAEESMMMEHVKEWLVSGYSEVPHPVTGATAMHVAACKGYIKVLDKLIKAGGDLNAVDCDGWTPLHAAAYWGQLEACAMLLKANCDTSILDNSYQTVFEVADPSSLPLLEPYRKNEEPKKPAIMRVVTLPPPPKKTALKKKQDTSTPQVKKDVHFKKTVTNIPTKEHEEDLGASEAEDTVADLPKSTLDQIPLEPSHSTCSNVPSSNLDTGSDIYNPLQFHFKVPPKVSDENTPEITLRRQREQKTKNMQSDLFLKPKDRDVPSTNFGDKGRKFGDGDKVSSSLPSLSSTSSATGSSAVTPSKSDYLKTSDAGGGGDAEESVPAWRRGGSLRTRTPTTSALPEEDPSNTSEKAAVRRTRSEATPEVSLRRAYSFESDTRFYFRLHEARERLRAIEAVSAAMNANLPDIYSLGTTKEGKGTESAESGQSVTSVTSQRVKTPTASNVNTPAVTSTSLQRANTVPSTTNTQGQELTPSARRKYLEETDSERFFNHSVNPASPEYNPEVVLRRRESDTAKAPRPTTISTTSPTAAARPLPSAPRRSFVPPARDEESETQRKAHAKRVRETRRSTQGVTLEELKSAEQYVKAQQSNDAAVTDQNQESTSAQSLSVPVTNTTHLPSSTPATSSSLKKEDDSLERRPSWRLRVDDADPSKFSLEDLRNTVTSPPHQSGSHPQPESKNKLESPMTSDPKYSPVIRTRRHDLKHGRPPRPPPEDEEGTSSGQVNEDPTETKAGAQGAIAKKKKPKRRSTGVVNYSSTWSDDIDGPQTHSDTESSRRGSDDGSAGQESPKSENGITTKVNYKKLYEETLKENVQLKSRVNSLEEEVNQLKASLERSNLSARLGSDVVDKKEKRALELKFQEMEEELKKAKTLQSDNQKLRDENGALIRVISKLSK